MSKPNGFYWWRYRNSDMEMLLHCCSPFAEGIAHRLMRSYFARDRDIPSTDETIAFVCGVNPQDVSAVRKELETVFDLSGPVVRIPWLDEDVDWQRSRSEHARTAARGRWNKGGRK